MAKMTQPQFDAIHNMIVKKDLAQIADPKQRAFLSDPANIQRLNKQQASNAIELLISLPWADTGPRPKAASPTEEAVSEGRYFIVDPTDNEAKFIKVDKPTEGRWAGYTFVHVQAAEDFYPVRNPQHRAAILTEIAKDPIESMRQYGLKIGVCGRCGITLTKDISRALGFGPICCEALGIPYVAPPTAQLDMDSVTDYLDSE